MTGRAGAGGLDAFVTDGVAELINRTLALDPANASRLSALEGRRLQLSSAFPAPLGQRDLTITVRAGALRLIPRPEPEPHVIVQAAPAELAAWITSRGARGSVRIDGDSAVLQELTALLRDFHPDLAAPLAALLGPEQASRALGGLELAFAGVRSLFQGAGYSVRDGAVQTFVDRPAANRLLDDIQDLRLRVERLGARVSAEEQRRKAP